MQCKLVALSVHNLADTFVLQQKQNEEKHSDSFQKLLATSVENQFFATL